jgi:hypothetical protein
MLSEQRRSDPDDSPPHGFPPATARPDLGAVSATQPLPVVRPHPGPSALAGPEADRERWLRTLVGQALDDVEEGRMPVPDALRMVARLAWRDGWDQSGR